MTQKLQEAQNDKAKALSDNTESQEKIDKALYAKNMAQMALKKQEELYEWASTRAEKELSVATQNGITLTKRVEVL